MATEIGELLIRIRADMAKLEEALKKSGTQVKSFSDKVTATGKNLTSAGLKLSLAVTAPLVLIGKKSMDAAMDVVESENLFEVSMGNMAKAARDWSEEFAKSVGLNEYNVRRNVGIFNVMFDSMGIGERKAYDMAKGLTELSYDMASFYNLDVEDAFTKLQAGITGEIEPLKRLGIVVNETAVATWAYTNGIAEQGEKLTEQEKIVARYGLIMERTANAQGDLARTLESPANLMRQFGEQIDKAIIVLGQGLIPVILKVVDVIKPFVEKFTNASDGTKKFVTALLLIAAAAGPTLIFFGSLIKSVGTLRAAFVSLNIATKGYLSTINIATAVAVAMYGIGKAGEIVSDKIDNFYIASLVRTVWPHAEFIHQTELMIKMIKGLIDGTIEWDTTLRNKREYEEYIDSLGEGAEKGLGFAEATAVLSEETKKYIDSSTEAKIATKDNEAALESLMAQYGLSREAAQEYAETEGLLKEANEDTTKSIEDQTGAVDNLRKSFDDLLGSLFDGINANNELQEAEWERAEIQEKLNKLISDGKQGTLEYEQTLNDLDAADQKVIESQFKVFTSIYTTTEEQERARQKALEYGAAMVLSGEWGEEAFVELATQFKLSGGEIITKAGELGVKLDEATKKRIAEVDAETVEAEKKIKAVGDALGKLDGKTANVFVNYNVKGSAGGSLKQSGGEVSKTGYIPDLKIIGIKGEGFLTREIMNAIKTNRTDYMGVSGRSRDIKARSTVNQIYVTVTEKVSEERIGKIIANELNWT